MLPLGQWLALGAAIVVLALLPASFVVNGTAGFVVGLAVLPGAVFAPLWLERRRTEAIVSQVHARAGSMDPGELERLVADLERAYGPLKPLRRLAGAG